MDRREFVRTSSGLLISASLAEACNPSTSGPVAGVFPTGTVKVLITGLGIGISVGGSAQVTRTDRPGSIPFTILLDGSGAGSASVVTGTYRAVYTPPPGYQAVTSNDLVVTVTEGGVTLVSVTVALIVTQGTLRIAITGLTGAAATSGSATLQRTDVGGQAPISVPIPLAPPQVDTVVAAGTYTVTYVAPSGFTVSGGSALNVVVAAGGTSTASFTVSPLVSVPSAGNIYDFGFEDGTSGSFVNTSILPFLGSGSPAWQIDSTQAYRGTKCVKLVYPQSVANVGNAFLYPLPQARSSLYVRFAYMQSNPFNNDAAGSNSDQAKVMRLLGPGLNGIFASFFITLTKDSNIGIPSMTFSDLEGNQQHYANRNLPVPNFNNLLGQWTLLEFFFDISVTNALVLKGWINGTQYWDDTVVVSNQGKTFGAVQFDGTINSMAAQSTAWFDTVGISSAPMGFPPP